MINTKSEYLLYTIHCFASYLIINKSKKVSKRPSKSNKGMI